MAMENNGNGGSENQDRSWNNGLAVAAQQVEDAQLAAVGRGDNHEQAGQETVGRQVEEDGRQVGALVGGAAGDLRGGVQREVGTSDGVLEEPQLSESGVKDNENFSEATNDGVKTFTCNICSDIFDQQRTVKRHITMKHVKPSVVGESARLKRGREDDSLGEGDNKKQKALYEFSESILEEFEKTTMYTSTQVEEDRDISTPILDQTIIRVKPRNVDEAMGIIGELDDKVKLLEEELETAKKRIVEQDTIIGVKEDAMAVFQGTINSLEEEKSKLESRIARLEKAIANMKGEIEYLRGAKNGGEKVKKLEKEVKEAESKNALNLKKVEDLVTQKARLEAEMVRMTKVCDLQMEAIEWEKKKKGTIEEISRPDDLKEVNQSEKVIMKIDAKCRKFESIAGCTFGEVCKYLHPNVHCEFYVKVGRCPISDCKELHMKRNGNNQDCYFWMSGSCRFSAADCNKGKHLREKFGTNKKETFLGETLAEKVSANQQPVGAMAGRRSFGNQGQQLGEDSYQNQQYLLGPQQHMVGGQQILREGPMQVGGQVWGMRQPFVEVQGQLLNGQVLGGRGRQQAAGGLPLSAGEQVHQLSRGGQLLDIPHSGMEWADSQSQKTGNSMPRAQGMVNNSMVGDMQMSSMQGLVNNSMMGVKQMNQGVFMGSNQGGR